MSVGRSQFDSMRAAPIVSRESALASTPRRSRRISLRVSTGNTYESSASRSIGFIVSQPYAMGRRRAVCQRGRAHVRALGQRLEVRAQRKVERHALEAAEAGHYLAPQVGVDEHAVHEHDRRPLAGHMGPDPAPCVELEDSSRTH
jgi:hypothetical protein